MKKELKFKPKSEQELKTISDKGLLSYFKAERIRFYSFQGKFFLEFGETKPEIKTDQIKINDIPFLEQLSICNDWQEYIHEIQSELKRRELK